MPDTIGFLSLPTESIATWSVALVLAFGLTVGCGSSGANSSTVPDGGVAPDGGVETSTNDGDGAGGGDDGAGGSDGTGGAPARDSGPLPGSDATAPPSSWINATGNLAGMPSECGNLTLVSAEPTSSLVIAGVALHGLYATQDGGKTWHALGSGAGSASITNRPSSIVYDPAHSDVFWESGIYNGGGVYKTTDNGVTLLGLGKITHNDLVSVDFTDPARKTLLVGGHEQKQTLYRSTDGGGTWTNVGLNLPAASHFSSAPIVIDGQTHLVGCCGWGSGTCGVWRTNNGGTSWTSVSTLSVAGTPLRATSGAIFWPIIYGGGMAKSTDQGQSWTQAVKGTVTSTPVELPDGRIVSIGNDHLMISSDGATWTAIGDPLPFKASGVAYSAQTKAFFIWHNDCGNAVLADAIMSAGFN